MLGELRASGPSTASELGRRFGESSGSTSYHLRQLERFGFIVEDAEQPSRRERRWRAAHERTNFRAPAAYEGEAGQELIGLVERQLADYLMDNLNAWVDGDWSPEWRAQLGGSDYLLRLGANDVRDLHAELGEVVERYESRQRDADDPESLPIALHLMALPMKAPHKRTGLAEGDL